MAKGFANEEVYEGVWREMGLTDSEYERIKEILGREPNFVEIGVFSVMWSEHCSYKNSRRILRLFPTSGPRVLQGPGENAGIVDIDDGQAVVFKIESHNHPSAIEPYQGAATGVGGIVRDVFTMGARPIAVLNSLRFGELDDPHVRHLFEGVVAGIGGYGNCLGLPTVAGEVYFHPSYKGNPLVNAMCVGLIDQKDIAKGVAQGVGNPVMAVGARTGRDGIHGATFASEELSEKSEDKRPAVQVGDPFMEKLLLEATLEIIKEGLVVGIQDMGAAGLTSSSCEMASRGGSGMVIDVLKVPRREEGMTPYEILLSESQERMLVVPKAGFEHRIMEIFDKWGLNAVVIGHVTDDGILCIKEGDKVVAEIPAKALTDNAPVYERCDCEPGYYADLRERSMANFGLEHIPPTKNLADTDGPPFNGILTALLAEPNLASKEWVYRQYDHHVQLNTVVEPGAADAAVLRIKGTKKGLAMTVDCNSRYVYMDPYQGGAIAIAEAARNISCTGAEPLAVTDCLNFGNPEKPEIFWQFKNSVIGMAEACRVLETPVIGGNVSFYNETKGEAVYPTPTVGMVGLLKNIEERATMAFKGKGQAILLLGETKAELGASEYLARIFDLEVGKVPAINLELEKQVQSFCRQLIADGMTNTAHDCAEGGLAAALAEMAMAGDIGAQISLNSDLKPEEVLFSETQSRILVTVEQDKLAQVLSLAQTAGVVCGQIGVTGGESLVVEIGNETFINLPVAKLKNVWQEAIPCMMS